MDVEFLRYKFEDGHDGVITETKCRTKKIKTDYYVFSNKLKSVPSDESGDQDIDNVSQRSLESETEQELKDEDQSLELKENNSEEFSLGVRHIQVVYMFLVALVAGAMRSSGAVAVLAVSDFTRSNDTYIQIHDWNRKIQGSILSSFFVGYAVMLYPAEVYLRQVGDKLAMLAVLLINGALSSAMPTIINKGGWVAACNSQLLIGMTQACVTPICSQLLSTWLMPGERRMFSYFIHFAIHLGTIIAFPISGMLSEARLGWELVYYSQAMMVLSMAAMWGLLTASSPEKHEAVGDSEKEMIREAMRTYQKKKLKTPWRRMVRSRNFWGLASAHAASNVVFVFFLSEVPVLLHSLNWSLRASALQSALPFIAIWLVYKLTSPVADFAHKIASLSYVIDIRYFRKSINGFGTLGVVVGLAVVPHLVSNWYRLAIVVLITVPAFIGVQLSGFLENHKDVTENFSSSLLMMSSVVASVAGAAVPFLTGVVIGDNVTDMRSWKLLFSTLSILYLVCNVVYSMLASGDRQSWDTGDKIKIGYNNDVSVELDEMDHSEFESGSADGI